MRFFRKPKNRRNRRDPLLEVRLQTRQMRALRLRTLGVCLGVAAGLVLGLAFAWRGGAWLLDRVLFENSAFALQTISVQTDGVLAVDQIRRWAGVRPDDNLWAVDLARVKRDLELVPLIKEAAVERVLPSRLNLRITEREPIARVFAFEPKPAGAGYTLVGYYLDAEGYVILLGASAPALRQIPGIDQLPVLVGVNSTDVPPGKPVESLQVRAALKLIAEFEQSPMLGRADLERIDLAAPGVLRVTTGQGGEICFATDRLDWQLHRWRTVYDHGCTVGKAIKSLDLSVTNNLPVAWADANTVPAPRSPILNPSHHRKKHV
jgi:cell division septal protein FtsQ